MTDKNDAVEALGMARQLIQEAKGADGPEGGFVTDSLDAAENWLDTVEAALSHTNTSEGVEAWNEERALAELSLLYNHTDDDSRQFTRWQMIDAMHHGRRHASPPTPDTTHNAELVGKLQKFLNMWNLANSERSNRIYGVNDVWLTNDMLERTIAALRTPDSDLLREAAECIDVLERVIATQIPKSQRPDTANARDLLARLSAAQKGGA